jgi:hypothetical protein
MKRTTLLVAALFIIGSYAAITTLDFSTPVDVSQWAAYSVPPMVFQSQVEFLGSQRLQVGVDATHIYTRTECDEHDNCTEVPDDTKVCNETFPDNCLHGRGHALTGNSYVSIDVVVPTAWISHPRSSLVYVHLLNAEDPDYSTMVGIRLQTAVGDNVATLSIHSPATDAWSTVDVDIAANIWYRMRFFITPPQVTLEIAEVDVAMTACLHTAVLDTTYSFNETLNYAANGFDTIYVLGENAGESYNNLYFDNLMFGPRDDADPCDWVAPLDSLEGWEYVIIGVSAFLTLVSGTTLACCKWDCFAQSKKLRAWLSSRLLNNGNSEIDLGDV